MISFSVPTRKKDEIIDLTEIIHDQLAAQEKEEGLCTIFTAHTTCALTTADLEEGTDEDFFEALRKSLPSIQYRHLHNPSHAPDHILASVVGPSVSIPFQGKKLMLGTWQHVVLVEFDGPRGRQIVVSIS